MEVMVEVEVEEEKKLQGKKRNKQMPRRQCLLDLSSPVDSLL